MNRGANDSTIATRIRGKPEETPLVGVVDVGSNTARLVMYAPSADGAFRAVHEQKEVPRLGLATGPDGSLAKEAVDRGIEALRRFSQTISAFGPVRVVGVATSAVRDAPNGSDFVARVREETGIPLRIISGVEEAQYAYLGVASAWELDDALTCDLGGGSLQIAEVRDGKLRNSVSLPLGGLRLTQRHLAHDPPKDRELDSLREYVRPAIRSAIEAFGGSGYRIFGVGGTVRALARTAIQIRDYPIFRVHGYPLRDRDLEALGELLVEMPADKRKEVPGIGGDRADVVLAGLIVFEELMRATETREIRVCGTGIREGLAAEAVQAKLPAPAEELARRSIVAAGEAFSFSATHAKAVTEAAGSLFDLVAGRWDWGRSERLALTVAAGMHDAGVAIDLFRHARHSAYLVRNFPLWGLDQREVLLASMVVFEHEGDEAPSKWRKEFLPILSGNDLVTGRRLGVILYAAEQLAPAAPRFALGSNSRSLTIRLGEEARLTLAPRTFDKVRKPLERELEVDVKLRDA
jgi:exopolyphosphatase/guanosine-5'-triphosphate,3'-diphosphate pyrophosphatase